MKHYSRNVWVLSVIFGAAFMVAVIHPGMELVHFLRTGEGTVDRDGTLIQTILSILRPEMAWMTLWLAIGGAALGAGFAALHLRLGRLRSPASPTVWSESSLQTLIAEGESDTLEFKSSMRWDWKLDRTNKNLEEVIAKSICGLMNHVGGILLIGVDDDGNAVGIEADYITLRHPNWDGFERSFVSLIKGRLGGEHCMHIHARNMRLGEKTVALIEVESVELPVYFRDRNTERYFVRAGNSTRELDVKEAVSHIAEKQAPHSANLK